MTHTLSNSGFLNQQIMTWTATPEDAWTKHIRPVLNTAGWIEDSKDISDEIKLSKRELLGTILVAHALRKQFNKPWFVGYDPIDGNQNDGHVTDGKNKLIVEHKVVFWFSGNVTFGLAG